jgi:O-acetylserine/cysteine efflux transporter
MSLIAAPQVLIASLILETGQREAIVSAGPKDWILILIFSLSAFVIPYIIWYGLLRLYRIDYIVPFTLLMPVVGVIAGVGLMGEPLSISMLVGGTIVLFGLAVIVRSPAQPQPRDAVNVTR